MTEKTAIENKSTPVISLKNMRGISELEILQKFLRNLDLILGLTTVSNRIVLQKLITEKQSTSTQN